MIVPRTRLLWWIALLAPPAAAAPFLPPILLIVFSISVVVVALIDAFLARSKPKGIHLILPAVVRFSKNRPGSISVQIQNEDQKAKVLRIGIPFPAEIETSDADLFAQLPRDTALSRIEWPCTPVKRGRFLLNRCFLEIASPLGLWSSRTAAPVQSELRVYPNIFEERKQVAALFLNKAAYGIHSRRMVGQGREFEKLREYVSGDSYDQIHWKATAKRRRPITKIFQVERTQEVYVIIDFSRLTAKQMDHETTLESFLRCALILGMVAQRQGDLFGILTFSDRVQSFLRAGNGKAHYGACRDALYTLQPQIVTPDFEDLFAFIRLRLRRRALLMILTDLNDPMLAETFVRSASLVARHHLVLVNMVRPANAAQLFSQPDADSVDSIYEKLSGHLLWQNLRDLTRVLQRYGIQLSQIDYARMSIDLVSQYLSIKQRQLL